MNAMNTLNEALVLVFAMGAVILFCRALPFLFSVGGRGDLKASPAKEAFLNFVEKIVPPAAMTVLAFNALGGAFNFSLDQALGFQAPGFMAPGFMDQIPLEGLISLGAAVFTALIHLWRRNALLSISGGTALYMLLLRLLH